MVLSQKSIDALNSLRKYLLDKDIAITIILFITILQNKKGIMLWHARFMKFKRNRYYNKSDEIH